MLSLLLSLSATIDAEWIRSQVPSMNSTLSVNSSWSRSGLAADEYEESRALAFLHFSSAAYCDEKSIADWGCSSCKSADSTFSAKVFTDPKTKTQVFVGHTSGESTENIVVSFRGSSNIPNWISNLNFPKEAKYPKCNGCKVHRGFYHAWDSVRERVVAEVRRLHKIQPTAQIFVTGHSLGAALAVLCAAELGASKQSLGFPIEGVYTYGEPRVGNQAFHDFYNTGTKVSWRITHWKDPVPTLPPAALGFHHISTEIFYDKKSTSYKNCNGSGEDKSCSRKFLANLNVANHLNYLGQPIPGPC